MTGRYRGRHGQAGDTGTDRDRGMQGQTRTGGYKGIHGHRDTGSDREGRGMQGQKGTGEYRGDKDMGIQGQTYPLSTTAN